MKYVARFDSAKVWLPRVVPIMDEYLQGRIRPDDAVVKLGWNETNFLRSLGHIFGLCRQGYKGFSIAPGPEKVYVAVLGGGGLVEVAMVCATKKKAMELITEHLKGSGYTAETWFKELEETNDYPDEDYDPTNLYLTEVQ